MGLIKSFADTYYSYRLLKILASKWEDTPAYKVGIIDSAGNKIVEKVSQDQMKEYASFDRIAYNLKRVVSKIPFSQNPFVRFATAIALLKESELTDDDVEKLLKDVDDEFDFMPPLFKKDEDTPVTNVGSGNIAMSDKPFLTKHILSRLPKKDY